jgi:hypothetical protein
MINDELTIDISLYMEFGIEINADGWSQLSVLDCVALGKRENKYKKKERRTTKLCSSFGFFQLFLKWMKIWNKKISQKHFFCMCFVRVCIFKKKNDYKVHMIRKLYSFGVLINDRFELRPRTLRKNKTLFFRVRIIVSYRWLPYFF